jgi:ABC-2 type transport system ATP-binding protein
MPIMDRGGKPMSAIRTVGLSKVYALPAWRGQKTALESLDLAIVAGEIYGFLGPNGAGKTTTIKILLGFIRPTAGEAFLFDVPADNPAARRVVGYLPEQPYFYRFMTPFEILCAHAGLAGVPRRQRKEAASHALELAGLTEHSHTPISKLSKGLAQRVGIAQALVGDPKLLILDEPTSGLDPIGRRHMRDLLESLRQSGTTVFLSSHVLQEIEHLCDRVGILSHGRLVAEGAPADIKISHPTTMLRTSDLTPRAAEELSALGATWDRREGETCLLVPSESVFVAVRILERHGLPLISVLAQRESLEDAFFRLAA